MNIATLTSGDPNRPTIGRAQRESLLEFAAQNRPVGWNMRAAFALSPAAEEDGVARMRAMGSVGEKTSVEISDRPRVEIVDRRDDPQFSRACEA